METGGPWQAVPLAAADAPAIQDLFARCAAFFELCYGAPPRPDEAVRQLADVPPRWEARELVGFRAPGGALSALVDAFAGYPAPRETWISLLVVDPAARGRGLGAAAFRWVERRARASGGRRIGLIVQEQNPAARRFWERLGFRVVGRATARNGALESPVWKMQLDLAAP